MVTQTDRISGVLGDLGIKTPCRVTTTANITLSGTQTIDGVAVVAGDRVLAKDQTTASQNGIWVADSSAWTRAPDFDGARDVVTGTMVFITAGSTHAGKIFRISTTGTIVPGTTSIAFTDTSNLVLVGLIATVDELNFTDGVTSAIQTQLNTKAATASVLALAGGTMTGDITMSGASVFDANASIAAHATTMDPWSLGNYVTATGAAVTLTAMANAPQAGAEVEIYMNAAHVFTDGAVFEVDGNANYTATIGDRVLLRAKSTTVFTVHPRKADGKAVAGTTKVVQVVNSTVSALATGTTLIPSDDTIPQNTEGDQYLTRAITPTSATNLLIIEVNAHAANSSAGGRMGMALFQDATANALAATTQGYDSGDKPITISMRHYMTAGTTSSTTFNVRLGSQNAGTTSFNGSAGARLFGGISSSSITITEVSA